MLESVIASPEVVHYICKRFDIKMSKKLGQNFLIKRGIVDEIVHAAELTPRGRSWYWHIDTGVSTKWC